MVAISHHSKTHPKFYYVLRAKIKSGRGFIIKRFLFCIDLEARLSDYETWVLIVTVSKQWLNAPFTKPFTRLHSKCYVKRLVSDNGFGRTYQRFSH